MTKKIRTLTAIFLSFCVAFTSLPLLAGDLDASAMAKKKIATKITLKAKASGKHKVKLSWNKVKNPGKGYAVFRDGKCIKRLGKKKLSFTDTGLKAGTTYRYQIKVYKTKKVKKWYNKKTKKWQKKKPAKKWRGKSRKITAYTYKRPSKKVYVTTKAALNTQKSQSDNSSYDYSQTPGETPEDDNSNDDNSITETWKVENYKGDISYITKHIVNGSVSYTVDTNGYAAIPITEADFPKYDRTIDAEMDGFIQKNGITITEGFYGTGGGSCFNRWEINVYGEGSDKSKISFEVEEPTERITVYEWDPDESKKQKQRFVLNETEYDCVMKDNRRLATVQEEDRENGRFFIASWQETGCGYMKGQIHVKAFYDGEQIFSAKTVDVTGRTTSLYETAKKAIATYGDKGNYEDNMFSIEKYVRENIPYSECTCWGGTAILEEYSAVEYGIYGFWGPGGSCYSVPDENGVIVGANGKRYTIEYASNYGMHTAFHLDDDPYTYYETQGYR